MTEDQRPGPASTDRKIVISIDVMSGDGGVAPVIGGLAKSALKNPEISFLLHGDAAQIEAALARRKDLAERCEIRHTDKVIAMDARPALAMRRGKGSSMWNAIDSVRQKEALVAVSCGNTGALMAVSTLLLRTLPNVHRPAIAVFWPSRNDAGYNIMLDVGADIRAEARDLLTYGVMGAAYAQHGLGLETPRIGLLNVGTEEHKGRDTLRDAGEKLAMRDGKDFRYIGYVEGSDIPSDRVDVIVTDGFTGNIALKTGEGTARLIRGLLREAFSHSILSRLGAFFAITSLRRLSKRIDPRRVNGGVFLGLNGTVVKSHGAADETGISAAVKLAFKLARSGFAEGLAERVASATPASDSDTLPADTPNASPSAKAS